MEEGSTLHSLTYAGPRVLFQRKNLHRTLSNIVGGVIGLITVLFILWGTWYTSELHIRLTAWGVASILAAVAAAGIYNWIYGKDKFVRITEDGIEDGDKLWSWQKIHDFGGYFSSDEEVTIQFSTSRSVIGTMFGSKYLLITPALSAEEFLSLRDAISREILPKFPHLKIAQQIHSGG